FFFYLPLPLSQCFPPPASGQPASLPWQALQIIATFLNNASALMLLLCYVVLNRPTVIKVANREVDDVSLKPGLLAIGAVAVIEAILVAAFPAYAGDVLFGVDLLSGVAGGIAISLVTSGALQIIPFLLYLYVVFQPFYPFINRTFPNRWGLIHHFDLCIMQLAFLLKIIIYIGATQLFGTKRFLFYMIHPRRIYENV